MMDKYTLFKCIVSGIIGAGVGVAITYYLEEQKIQKVVDDVYAELYAEENAEYEQEGASEDEDDEIVAVNPTDVEFYKGVAEKAGYTQYSDKSDDRDIPTNIKRNAFEEHANDEPDRAELEAPAEAGDDTKKPFFIDEDDVENEGFELQTLVYYEGDGVLTTEDDEMIDDVKALVGDAIEVLESDGSVDRLYVRNRQKEVDYEIVRYAYSFSETQQ